MSPTTSCLNSRTAGASRTFANRPTVKPGGGGKSVSMTGRRRATSALADADRHARFQACDAAIAEIPEYNFVPVELQRQYERRLHIHEPETLWQDADNLALAPVDHDLFSDRRRGPRVAPLPVTIRQQRGAGTAVFVVAPREAAAKLRVNAQEGQRAIGNQKALDALRLSDSGCMLPEPPV